MNHRRKLIEVAMPLVAINAEAAREKSIRHGHPSTLHLWGARRPLAVCRAVLFGQLVDDPSSVPEEFPAAAAQEAARERLHRLLGELVRWESSSEERPPEGDEGTTAGTRGGGEGPGGTGGDGIYPIAGGDGNGGGVGERTESTFRRLHGAVPLDTLRLGTKAGQIAEEILAHLAKLPDADVEVTLEIQVRVPNGIPEDTRRIVTENCRTLGLEDQGFEEE